MGDTTFSYIRRRLLETEMRLQEAEQQIDLLSDVVAKLVDRYLPQLKHDAAAIDRELFVNQKQQGLSQ
jgi:hypothetical protein